MSRDYFDERGRELPDPTPVAATLRIQPVSEYQRIRELVRRELSEAAANNGAESFQEANDFDVGDDYDPTTPYEEQFDPETGASQWDFVQEQPIERGEGGQVPPASPPSVDTPPPETSENV